MKIAIVVHGRFHAFDLARALIQQGQEVALFTNYPGWAMSRFGIPRGKVRGFWLHGILSRLGWATREKAPSLYPEAWLHRLFGRWAAAMVVKENWDVVHCWSGVAEETFRAVESGRTLRLLMRCSSHIRTQARILEEEERRTRTRMDRPSRWMIAREEREYGLADRIGVLSTFAHRSFVTEGIPDEKLCRVQLGARVEAFRPSRELVEARCQRILSGEPLRVLNVGTFSFRKGMWDAGAIIRELDTGRFTFRFVGPIAPEASALAKRLRSSATFVPTQRETELPAFYAWADTFLLPTLEDGFQYVLNQAAASALPILTTPNGAGTDLVREGITGFVLPIRCPEAFVKRLLWCDSNRAALVAMIRRLYEGCGPRDWSQAATDFEAICGEKRSASDVSVASIERPA